MDKRTMKTVSFRIRVVYNSVEVPLHPSPFTSVHVPKTSFATSCIQKRKILETGYHKEGESSNPTLTVGSMVRWSKETVKASKSRFAITLSPSARDSGQLRGLQLFHLCLPQPLSYPESGALVVGAKVPQQHTVIQYSSNLRPSRPVK